jgi:flagellar hook-associated protein 3 FlgL
MRVSDQQRFRSFTSDIQLRLANLTRIQQEVGTGRSIFSPSDNVNQANTALRAESQIAENAQFLKNIDDGKAWVNSADGALSSLADLMNQIDALAISADNDTQTEEDRRNIAVQLDQKLEQLTTLINSTHGDRYIFGGHNTTSVPFVVQRDANGRIIGASANEESVGGKIYRRIGQNDDVQINVPGDQMFQPVGEAGTGKDIFFVVSSLRDTIANNNTPPDGTDDSHANQNLREQLKAIREGITTQQSFLGSVGQRLELTKSRLKDVEINLTDVQEQAEGVDIPSLTSRLASEQGAYNALLTINSKLLSQSLVDYIS